MLTAKTLIENLVTKQHADNAAASFPLDVLDTSAFAAAQANISANGVANGLSQADIDSAVAALQTIIDMATDMNALINLRASDMAALDAIKMAIDFDQNQVDSNASSAGLAPIVKALGDLNALRTAGPNSWGMAIARPGVPYAVPLQLLMS